MNASGVMKPDEALGETVEAFQSVVLAARLLERDGIIKINDLRHTSCTVDRPVLSIFFTWLR